MDGLTQLADLQARRNGHRGGEYAVSIDDKGKLKLPEKPGVGDVDGLCRWLTAVFNLNPDHPVTAGERQGIHGPEGHAKISRRGAPPLRFEPITRLSNPTRLREVLEGSTLHTDGEPWGYKNEHCFQIAHVVRMLCGEAERLSAEAETFGIIDAFLADAVPVEGHTTYGTAAQRYEAAVALQRAAGEYGDPGRYLLDANTGEFVLSVGALAATARRQFGSLPRGWLDGRIRDIGWERVKLDGHQLSGREGRSGPHARVNVYRGLLPMSDSDESVTT